MAHWCLAGTQIGAGVPASQIACRRCHGRATQLLGGRNQPAQPARKPGLAHGRNNFHAKRCTVYDESADAYQQDLDVEVSPKGTKYVLLKSPAILPDSLPSSKHCLRTGGLAHFARFACLGQECDAPGRLPHSGQTSSGQGVAVAAHSVRLL